MKRALVLCGGGSLGSYEIGAWKYLREKGITFDIVTGTSIGSINGAMVVVNDFEKAESLWKDISSEKVMMNGMNFYAGFLKNINRQKTENLWAFAKTFINHKGADISPLRDLIQRMINPRIIKQSPIRFGIVTTRVPSMKEVDVVLNDVPESKVLDYLLASSACFPIFPMYRLDGHYYIDGGYNNNLPIDFALSLGADEVVAVLLHGVPKTPQKAELMKLPFVTLVQPSRETGSIMDFYGEVTTRNMILGYNDCKKAFKDAWGYTFTFEIDERYLTIAKQFDYSLAKYYPNAYHQIMAALAFEDALPGDSLQVFLRSIEELGDWLSLDYTPIYSIDAFIEKCIASAKGKRDKHTSLFVKQYNYSSPLPSKNKAEFLSYLEYLEINHLKTSHIDEMGKKTPLAYCFKELFAYFIESGRIPQKKQKPRLS